ncbi:MAG TPA: thiol reductant ABC exporter subunit CydD [Verrucomicrobia bacterium]|nr:MAG: thiol reductant ABC exporter subunit CydD [Lentisphaerae bacterium GWF2_57_35]HBA85314.1 thiol reductant ABC exporter subunit CydD [Verrucomicrobiota bacterium]
MNLDRRLLALVRSHRPALAGAVGFGILAAWLAVAQAWCLSRAIAMAFLERAALPALSMWLAAYTLLAFLRATAGWLAQEEGARLSFHIKRTLRERLLAHIARLGPAGLPNERSGELVHTLFGGINSLDAWLGEYLPQFFRAIGIPLSLLFIVLPLDWISGAILLVTAPLIPFFMILIGASADARARRQWQTLSRLSAHFLDVLQGLTTIKLLGRSQAEAVTIEQVTTAFRHTTMSVLRIAFLSALVLELLATLSTALIAVSLGVRLLHGSIPFQSALFVLILAPDFYLPLRQLGARYHAGLSGATAAGRLFGLLETQPAMTLPSKPEQPPPAPFSISFHEIAHAYQDGTRPTLQGVSFTLRPGETTVLIGPSGAGKSTIVQLLLGFMAPQAGSILIDGMPLAAIDPSAWRDRIAWVPQRPFLFHATLAENLRLAKPEATLEDLTVAAQAAGLHDTIAQWPQGYDTPIGERGGRLSGGEIQRLAIARAFLKNAPFLILDEPTSQLAPEQEDSIYQAIQRLTKDRTTLLITHRLSTIRDDMHVLVLSDGQLLEDGYAGALKAQNGWFARLTKGASA